MFAYLALSSSGFPKRRRKVTNPFFLFYLFHPILLQLSLKRSLRSTNASVQACIEDWRRSSASMTLFQLNGCPKVFTPPIYVSIMAAFSFYPIFLSEVQAKGPEVARGLVCVDHGWGRDGDEELVAGPQLKQSSLVDGVESILGVRGPALCSHPLQELHRIAGKKKKMYYCQLSKGTTVFHMKMDNIPVWGLDRRFSCRRTAPAGGWRCAGLRQWLLGTDNENIPGGRKERAKKMKYYNCCSLLSQKDSLDQYINYSTI